MFASHAMMGLALLCPLKIMTWPVLPSILTLAPSSINWLALLTPTMVGISNSLPTIARIGPGLHKVHPNVLPALPFELPT